MSPDEWIADDVMQAVATEINLSEAVFFVRDGLDYQIRWFTTRTMTVNKTVHA
jgi:predicted PhzF superfamily epimerase YddE/YHI9